LIKVQTLRGGFTEENELPLRVETNRPSADKALQFYASGGLLQVVGDTTEVHKSTISQFIHWQSIVEAILETITVLGKLHYGILIVD